MRQAADARACSVSGSTGLSLARWLARHGARVRVADTRAGAAGAERARARRCPASALDTGPFVDVDASPASDLIAISPGVAAATSRRSREAVARGAELVGDVELFARALPRRRRTVIAITGTNGKTHGHRARRRAVRARRGSRRGRRQHRPAGARRARATRSAARRGPRCACSSSPASSSRPTSSLDADAAAVLNVTQNHLDRYAGMRRLRRGEGAHLRRARHAGAEPRRPDRAPMRHAGRDACRPSALGVPRRGASGAWSSAGGGAWLARGGELLVPRRRAGARRACTTRSTRSPRSRSCSSVARIGTPRARARSRAFRGLPHRMERVAESGGVLFFDDSKGTNVGATRGRARRASAGRSVLIAGGDGKGQDFAPLAPAVTRALRARCVLIGRDAPAIERGARRRERAASSASARSTRRSTRAFALARPGDAVLLSPACASLDHVRATTASAASASRARARALREAPVRKRVTETRACSRSTGLIARRPRAARPAHDARATTRRSRGRRCCCSRSGW